MIGIYKINPVKWAVMPFVALLITSCVGAPKLPITSFSQVDNKETVVVGRVELVPPLEKDEQELSFTVKKYRGKTLLITDETYRELDDLNPGDFSGRIEAALGKTFYVKAPNKPFYILAGVIFMRVAGTTNERAYLPAGFKIDIKPNDKAIYIGTVRYYRDEFFKITKVEIKDNYEEENTEFRKLFGNKFKLRKELVDIVRNHK